MTTFDSQYFQKFNYSEKQVQHFYSNAQKDLNLARGVKSPDIIYRICYDAVLKLGVAIIALHGFKIRSVPGHHVLILKKMAEILELKNEIPYLNNIRKKRNIDLYNGGIDFTHKEAVDLLQVVESIFRKAQK